MNEIHLSAREVQDEQVKKWIADWGEGLQDDHRALQGVLTIFANVLEKNLSTPGATEEITRAFIKCVKIIDFYYYPDDPDDPDTYDRYGEDLD